MKEIIKAAVDRGASEIHIKSGGAGLDFMQQ
jgi:type II secretory ATPase GspE/PulE/Tfp pilus assembly ATPase PilB-like protein